MNAGANMGSDDLSALFAGMPDLMTAKELEAVIRRDKKTLYNDAKRGLIPYIRIQSSILFPKTQIIAWLTEQNYRPRGPMNGGGEKNL